MPKEITLEKLINAFILHVMILLLHNYKLIII